MNERLSLGKIGIFSSELKLYPARDAAEAAAELEKLGFAALWMPGIADSDTLDKLSVLLAATKRIVVASGVLNIWMHEPVQVAAWWRSLTNEDQERTLLGLGVSHVSLVGERYSRSPMTAMGQYLDALQEQSVPARNLCIGAMGPNMQKLACQRTSGIHPYYVRPEDTAEARVRLGADVLLAPEQGVIFETDPERARAIARSYLGFYRTFPTHQKNWERMGFSEDEISTLSPRLCDALYAWGNIDKIVDRVRGHLDAGADHVCVQVVRDSNSSENSLPLREWRALAEALPKMTGS
jgi:probable F420-dependent oxidoreductase